MEAAGIEPAQDFNRRVQSRAAPCQGWRRPGTKANAIAERFVRTVRSECLDWLLIHNRRQLARVLRVFVLHYNGHRPHRALNLNPPDSQRPTPRLASLARPEGITRRDHLGGLIHEYSLAA